MEYTNNYFKTSTPIFEALILFNPLTPMSD